MNLVHNMSCPPRTKVVLQGRPVSSRVVVFSLVLALVETGHFLTLGKPGSTHILIDAEEFWWKAARTAVLNKWPTPQDLFVSIGKPELLKVEVDFLIGFRRLGSHAGLDFEICKNPRLCVGVQSQCAGTLFLSRRAPDLTWDRLLDAPVAFDDPLVTLS